MTEIGGMPVIDFLRSEKGRKIINSHANMATCSTDVWWGKEFASCDRNAILAHIAHGEQIDATADFTATEEHFCVYTDLADCVMYCDTDPYTEEIHECEVIQRMSEAWRSRND